MTLHHHHDGEHRLVKLLATGARFHDADMVLRLRTLSKCRTYGSWWQR